MVEKQFREMVRAHRDPKTVAPCRASLSLLVEYFGSEKPVAGIQRPEMSDFLCELEKKPTRRKLDSYGQGFKAATLLKELANVRLEGLDLRHLYEK